MTIQRALLITLLAVAVAALIQPAAQAQTFGPSATTTLSVTIGPEASIAISASSTTLSANGTAFSSDFLGSTSFAYKIRTSKTGGTGNIGLEVTSDFSPASGPSVANPPTAGDALTYTCTVSSPGTGCTGSQTSSTTAATSVATFGADAHSGKTGNAGSVNWDLTNDPKYGTGSYTATVTFTISAT